MATVVGRCLNCEAELSGPFCAACGQRAVPPDPTIAERLAMALTVMGYGLKALKAVYGGGWPATVAKAASIGFIYLVASIPAFVIILAWAAMAS